MSYLIDVIITWPLWGALTYECGILPESGARVIVPIGNKKRVGFVLGLSKNKPEIEIKSVSEILDSRRVIDSDLWDMILWSGRVCMCGSGSALNLILPQKFLNGEKIAASRVIRDESRKFCEINCFNPYDPERLDFYVNELEKPGRALMLLPTHERAANFFANLPDTLKSDSILWPPANKRIWDIWKLVHMKNFRVVIAAPGGIFAPLSPDRIIIDDESNPAYIIPYALNISARSLAGRRALFNHAELITGGNVPSLKTFKRSKPLQQIKPVRENIIIVDINFSRKFQEKGIDGNIPLTFSLIKRTYKELIKKNNVIWILNRLGESSEVFCDNCGESIKCTKCGHVMRSEEDGQILRCRFCGYSREVPEKCESCGFEILRGKRPGLDALAKIIAPYYKNIYIYGDKSRKKNFHGLILSTQRGLELCEKINPSLIAWLDIDSELWRQDYNTRFNVMRLLYESYFRGRGKESDRKILIQARPSGRIFASQVLAGWEKFLCDELKSREEYNLPPYGCMIEINCVGVLRETVIELLESANFFVMDPGDEKLPLVVNTDSLESLRKVLEPLCMVGHKNKNIPNITIRSE